jgi:hypothetical protein
MHYLDPMKTKNQLTGLGTFTKLEARICEEDGAFTVTVRLKNRRKKSEVAWGQEIAPTIEMASLMIGALAEQFSIPQKGISIGIDMENFRDGTLH